MSVKCHFCNIKSNGILCFKYLTLDNISKSLPVCSLHFNMLFGLCYSKDQIVNTNQKEYLNIKRLENELNIVNERRI